MILDELLDELEGVRHSGSGYMARCPAHDDRTQSLQVSERENGSLGVFCQAGCETRSVMNAIGRDLRDLFPDTGEKIYTYRDEAGTPLYDVVRLPGKDFYQRRYVNGETVRGLENTRRVLYRLPDVLASSPDRWVFVVEGEKDAESFWERGYIATCNVGGAGKWTDEYSDALAGRYVTIVQDKDDAGRRHASQVMLSLQDKAKQVRLLEARTGKDAYDHFHAGYGVDDFVEPSLFTPLDFDKPTPPIEWILDGYIAVGDLVLASGVPGIGKSWFTMGLAVAMANGQTHFLGLPVKNGKVLYFDEENPEDVIRDRIHMKLGHQLKNYPNLRYVAGAGLRLDSHPDKLITEALMFRPQLIVLDSLARVHAKEENSFAEMSEILNGVLKPLARQTGAAVVVIHHHDKAGHGPRGSGDIEAAPDCTLDLRGTPGSGTFVVRIRKSRRRLSNEGLIVHITETPGIGTRLEAHS